MTVVDQMDPSFVEFGVVLNDIPFDTSLPITIAGWSLDWANPDEGVEVASLIRPFAVPHVGQPLQEYRLEPQDGGGVSYQQADPDDWRYTVVRPEASANLGIHKLIEALRVSEADLWVEAWKPAESARRGGILPTSVGRLTAAGQYWADWVTRPLMPPPVPVDNLKEVVSLRAAFDDARYPEIAQSLALFRDLDAVPETSRAKVLGYFSVLESLLSHAPAPSDPVDSITRQLRRNLTLIAHRLPSETPLPLHFVGSNGLGQVVSKLYAVRSAYAHGGAGKSDLAWLESRRPPELAELPTWLPNVMRQTTRRVLQAALREPQLVTDLRGDRG